MPRYRFPHPTDGPGIGNKLRGEKQRVRFHELREIIETSHNAAVRDGHAIDSHVSSYLEHARKAGDALHEAKRRLGHKLRWSKWRNSLLSKVSMSRETTINYMRIARNWELIEKSDVKIISINQALIMLRRKTAPPRDPTRAKHTAAIRKDLHRFITRYLASLSDEQLQTYFLCRNAVFFSLSSDLQRLCELERRFCEWEYGPDDNLIDYAEFEPEDDDESADEWRPAGIRPRSIG